jgi:hypothetical protein
MASIKKIQEFKKTSNYRNVDSADLWKTMAHTATKDAIAHVFGVQLIKELFYFECSEGDIEAVTVASLQTMKDDCRSKSPTQSSIQTERCNERQQNINNLSTVLLDSNNSIIKSSTCGLTESIDITSNDIGMKLASASSNNMESNRFAYRAHGFMSNGSYCTPKASSSFILFINDRLVESVSLRRALENLYATSLPKGVKPFVYLALYLPGPHVDVNVHPSKREVAFLHMDLLCETLVSAVKKLLFSNVKTFRTQTLLPSKGKVSVQDTLNNAKNANYAIDIPLANSDTVSNQKPSDSNYTSTTLHPAIVVNTYSSSVAKLPQNGAHVQDDRTNVTFSSETELPIKMDDASKKQKVSNDRDHLKVKKQYDPKNLVRVIQPHGSLEPYLLRPTSNDNSLRVHGHENLSASTMVDGQNIDAHKPFCEFSTQNKTMDISIPGAFATICRCQVGENGKFSVGVSKPKSKKVTPTSCELTSVRKLRSSVDDKMNESWTTKIRESIFVGCVSRHRSLIQSGIELM